MPSAQHIGLSRRHCDICRHKIAFVGPCYDLRRMSRANGPRKLKFRFCQPCFVVIEASLRRTIERNWGDA